MGCTLGKPAVVLEAPEFSSPDPKLGLPRSGSGRTTASSPVSSSVDYTPQTISSRISSPTTTPAGFNSRKSDGSSPSFEEKTMSPAAQAGLNSAIDPGMFIQKGHAHLSDRYIKERKLGSGAYGEVLLCRDKQTGAERAVKIIKKASVSAAANVNILEEVAVVKQLDHPNIMKLYEFFDDKKNYYLVSEVYKGGELFDEIINRQKFTEADAANTIQQVLSGVTYLHKHQIVHRDLKPENLLLETKGKDSLIKIVDFGLSSSFDPKKKLKDRLGTAYYIAPEVLKQKYDEKCDVWSCGVILYILLCGYPPFGGNTDKEILHRVGKGKFAFDPPEWDDISSEVKELISKMLTFDPAKRISAEACLQHPWIQRSHSDEQRAIMSSTVLINALGNMRKFQACQKLAQAALFFIGSKLTTLDETRELTTIFRTLDTNGDGQLDRNELIQGYEKLMKLKGGEDSAPIVERSRQQIESEVDKILDSADFDKNGFIEYSEFVTVAMDKKVLLSRTRLQVAFSMFDHDGSGKIAADELRRILNDVDDDHWAMIIREVDENDDGEIDFDEFVGMMQKLWLDPKQDIDQHTPIPNNSSVVASKYNSKNLSQSKNF